MKITNLRIENYRNIKKIDIKLNNVVVLIGENNSGKSNILKAVTLPFLSDDIGITNKNLKWNDFNDEEKEKYYDYIFSNSHKILKGQLPLEEFKSVLPKIYVEVSFESNEKELYYVRNFATKSRDGIKIEHCLCYSFEPKECSKILVHIKNVLSQIADQGKKITGDDIKKLKQNLLPVELYSYSIHVPRKTKKLHMMT